MSSDAQPINPARFAEALKDLSAENLALKVFELRNSIAHLDYSNAELKPFAEGYASASSAATPGQPDQDCIDAIAENEVVIARMQERIELIRTEVEARGLSWTELQGKAPEEDDGSSNTIIADSAASTATTNGAVNGTSTNGGEHAAWSDGTFQTGTIRLGGPGLSDEELVRRLQERLPGLNDEDGPDEDGGMHL